ncbi:MAG: hypothetical protein WAU16_10145 [Rhizobiaceae bacterium]
MKTITATKMMAALTILSMAFPVSGLAADGAWTANHACNIASPERGDAPRVTLSFADRGDIGGEMVNATRFRLFNIPKLSEGERTVFSDIVAEVPGFARWTDLKGEGKLEGTDYALYISLPNIAQVVAPLESGRVLKVTVQTKGGSQAFEIDLTGSAKAIASFRACAT